MITAGVACAIAALLVTIVAFDALAAIIVALISAFFHAISAIFVFCYHHWLVILLICALALAI